MLQKVFAGKADLSYNAYEALAFEPVFVASLLDAGFELRDQFLLILKAELVFNSLEHCAFVLWSHFTACNFGKKEVQVAFEAGETKHQQTVFFLVAKQAILQMLVFELVIILKDVEPGFVDDVIFEEF